VAALPEDVEILDIVDDHDEVIGKLTRAEAYDLAYETGHLRAADIFLMNDEGRLWIPVRSAAKKSFPNAFDFSAGEHVQAGEPYIDAAVRGLDEELNLVVNPRDLTEAGVQPPVPEINYFRALFLYRTNETPAYNPEDFSSAAWLTKEELKAKIAGGMAAKMSIVPSLEYLEAQGLL
jgi:isopentenyldiphosphate isomerase